jgi:hypothetical protein
VVVNTAFVLAIVAVAVTVMTHEALQVRHGVRDLVPRIVVGVGSWSSRCDPAGEVGKDEDELVHGQRWGLLAGWLFASPVAYSLGCGSLEGGYWGMTPSR